MAEESNMTKPPKEEEHDGGGVTDSVDRLSNLSDSLLCHIMSFLPMRTSVAMSLVSPRYLHLWKDLKVFYFDFPPSILFQRVALFINSVLYLRKSRHIQKFHLTLPFDFNSTHILYQFACVNTWTFVAIGPHLQELVLYIGGVFIDIPPSLFINFPKLVSLSISGAKILVFQPEHSSFHFPSLKMLSLSSGIVGIDGLVSLLYGCPNLETLEVPFYFISRGISLTETLVTPSSGDNFTWTYFNINKGCFKLGIIGNFHSMLEAFLDVFSPAQSEFVDPTLNLIQDGKSEFHIGLLDNEDDVYLQLRHSTSKWPIHAPVLDYTEFRDLHHLKFILPCFNSNLLVNALEKCHMLQVLIIQSNKEEPPPLRTWQPESTTVSECLKSHLTYVHIEGYQGLEDDLTFAEYILRNELVLKTMLIFVDILMDKTDKDRSLKRLTGIPRGSITCQLKFDPDVSS